MNIMPAAKRALKSSFPIIVVGFLLRILPAECGGAVARPLGTTNLLLTEHAVGTVPPIPFSRVRVPVNETVTITAPRTWGASYQWFKNGQPLTGATQETYTIPLTTSSDGGRYHLGSVGSKLTSYIELDVVGLGNLANLSALVKLAAGNDIKITGFVVTGRQAKNLLIRAVGPSLRTFGIQDPAPRPRIRFYDSTGQEVSFGGIPEVDWAARFAAAGAFPLSADERPFIAMNGGPFEAGNYTVHVSDDSGTGGTVLVEIYEVSEL